jgi:hypothetical protein
MASFALLGGRRDLAPRASSSKCIELPAIKSPGALLDANPHFEPHPIGTDRGLHRDWAVLRFPTRSCGLWRAPFSPRTTSLWRFPARWCQARATFPCLPREVAHSMRPLDDEEDPAIWFCSGPVFTGSALNSRKPQNRTVNESSPDL